MWQDKVYYLGREYPAGYFAAGVLNVSHNLFDYLSGEGGFLLDAYAIAKFGDREQLGASPRALGICGKYVALASSGTSLSLWNMEAELGKMRAMLSKTTSTSCWITQRRKCGSSPYLRAGILLPISIYHFVIAAWHLETYYLHRLGKRDETHFAVAFHDFYHDSSTKRGLEKCLLPTMRAVRCESPSAFLPPTFARDPKDEKEDDFRQPGVLLSYMDFYVYDLLNGMHWGSCPSFV